MVTDTNNADSGKGSGDKIHNSDLGETKDFNQLSFNKEKNSYELDVKGPDKDYDHPLPYDTTAENGGDENSDYDEANPYIGDEYATREEKRKAELDNQGMHIDHGEIVEVNEEDELLARTPEDDRTDLDEEGYPLNDEPKLR
jgi:hypothetical protein